MLKTIQNKTDQTIFIKNMAAKYRNIQKLRLQIKAVLFYRKKVG